MNITITICTDNAAFEANGEGTETAMILSGINHNIRLIKELDGGVVKLRDSTGVAVGEFKVDPPTQPHCPICDTQLINTESIHTCPECRWSR